jgi:hypothetical protein
MAALARANEVRDERKTLKQRLKARDLHVADLIEAPPHVVANVPIGDLLRWAPRVGPARARTLLGSIDASRPVARVGPMRRLELADRLRRRVL